MNINYEINKIKKVLNKKHNNNDIWIFGEWYGTKCCDNCMYLANYIASINNNLKLYWIANSDAKIGNLDKRITILSRDDQYTMNIVGNADVIIVNQGVVDITSDLFYVPKKSVFVNLWHGVPWKKIFLDVIQINKLKKTIKKFLSITDIYLSTSRQFSQILSSQFSRDNVLIINAGYPRNSIFYNKELLIQNRDNFCNLFNIDKNKTIITYMPTFRDKHSKNFDFSDIINDSKFVNILDKHNVVIIQKKHFINSKQSFENNNSKYIINLESDFSSQELLSVSDMLITDYSSCFFDYLLLDKPIIHYLYDYDYYKNEDRGLYYSKERVVCGDCPETINELIDAIDENLKNPNKYRELRKKRKEEYMTYESKDSCKIIYEEIMKKVSSH